MSVLVCLLALLLTTCSANYVFSRTYQTGKALPLTELDQFVASLPTSSVQSIQVQGSDGTNFKCAVKATAQAIVTGWKTFGTYPQGGYTHQCGGETWYTGGCCGHTIEIGGPFLCACQQKWSIRSGAGCSWGTNWGGTTCPAQGPLTLTVTVVTCSENLEQGDSCALGGVGCDNCLCRAGYEPFSPARKDCAVTDMCARYGYSGRSQNTLSCTNSAINQRTVVCQPGYFVTGYPQTQSSITIVGTNAFPGCSDIDECNLYGFNGFRDGVDSCINQINSRTIVCKPGYYAIAPTTDRVTLVGGAPFTGCTQINECAVYGYSGKEANTRSCTDGINTRTILCQDGYGVVGTTSSPSVVLTGSAPFPGCFKIDMCEVYGYSGKPQFTARCVSGLNNRTIYCAQGYYPKGHAETVDEDDDYITLVGPTPFAGCTEENLCTTVGYSGKNLYTLDCDPAPNSRTITCQPGYHAEGSTPETNPKVTLTFHAPFLGCTQIDNCKVYGTNGKDQNVKGCVNGVNTRTISCNQGTYISGTPQKSPTTTSVTLTGNAQFVGCIDIDECVFYGNSGKPENVLSCQNLDNARNITCKPGFYAVDGAEQYNNAIPWIKLIAEAPFKGCAEIPTCKIYGFSGKGNNTLECAQPTSNTRIISCIPGFYAIAPNIPNITLVGPAPFGGCFDIDECLAYGNNGKTEGFKACENSGVNLRTIICQDGYAAIKPTMPQVTLTGQMVFEGCTRIDMCQEYGYKEHPEHVLGCTNTAINERTIQCAEHYAVITLSGGGGERQIEDYSGNTTIVGPRVFGGCVAWCGDGYKLPEEECEDGNLDEDDGCDEFCKVQPGWMCSTTTSGKCCKIVDTDIVSQLGLTCYDGYFVGVKPKTPLIIAGPTQVIDGDLSLCGDVRVGYADSRVAEMDIEFRLENLVLPPGVTLTIAGTLYLDQTAVVAFHPKGNIKIVPHCLEERDPASQFTVTPSALLKTKQTMESGTPDLLLGGPRDEDDTTWFAPGPYITASGCGTFNSWEYMASSEGDFSSGKFPMIVSGCQSISKPFVEGEEADVIRRHRADINASCPSVSGYPVNSSIIVEINQPTLCVPQIIGITVGTVGGLAALAALGAVAYMMAAPAAVVGEGGGYVAM